MELGGFVLFLISLADDHGLGLIILCATVCFVVPTTMTALVGRSLAAGRAEGDISAIQFKRKTSPEGSYGLFREYRRRAILIREVDVGEEWFGLRIVGDGNASGSSR